MGSGLAASAMTKVISCISPALSSLKEEIVVIPSTSCPQLPTTSIGVRKQKCKRPLSRKVLLQEHLQTTTIYRENGQFHSNTACSDPVWNYRGIKNKYGITILFEIITFSIRKPFLCNRNCNFRKIIPRTIFYVTVPNCNCKDIFPSDPQNCNCNGN